MLLVGVRECERVLVQLSVREGVLAGSLGICKESSLR